MSGVPGQSAGWDKLMASIRSAPDMPNIFKLKASSLECIEKLHNRLSMIVNWFNLSWCEIYACPILYYLK